jgi:predicted nucleic acid-binding protein
MTIFVDTSALYAVLDVDDANHERARDGWARLLSERSILFTHNYVLVETAALVQHRLGLVALRSLQEDVVPILSIEWISGPQHDAAMGMALAGARRKLSLVDCCSFLVMREHGLQEAFCLDRHFREQGFRLTPGR